MCSYAFSSTQALYLRENRIKAVHGDTFSYMRNLRVMRLDRNGMSAIYDRNFEGLYSLATLSLDHNNLRSDSIVI